MGPQLAGGLLHHAEVAIVEAAAEAGLPLGVARVLDVQRAVAERLPALAVGRGRGHRHPVAPFVLAVRRAATSALPLATPRAALRWRPRASDRPTGVAGKGVSVRVE